MALRRDCPRVNLGVGRGPGFDRLCVIRPPCARPLSLISLDSESLSDITPAVRERMRSPNSELVSRSFRRRGVAVAKLERIAPSDDLACLLISDFAQSSAKVIHSQNQLQENDMKSIHCATVTDGGDVSSVLTTDRESVRCDGQKKIGPVHLYFDCVDWFDSRNDLSPSRPQHRSC